jgi:hypothetical protein
MVDRHPDRPSWVILGLPFLATGPPRRRIGLIEASATTPITSGKSSGTYRHPAASPYTTER